MTSVLLVDDQQLMRAGFRVILESEPGITVVGDAANGADAIRLARQLSPDVICMDVQMPGMDGLEALYSIRQDAPETRVAMITAHGSVATAVDAMKFGAVDFLSKPFVPSDIRALVHQIEARDAGPASAAPAEAPPDAA